MGNYALLEKAEIQKKSGVYITDYVADGYLYYHPDVYKSYQDLIGEIGTYYMTYEVRKSGGLYINGIIKTDYESKMKRLLDAAAKDKNNKEYVMKEEYQDSINYLFNALTLLYSTNINFFDDLSVEETVNHYFVNGLIQRDSIPLYSKIVTIGVNPCLKPGEVAFANNFITYLTSDLPKTFVASYNSESNTSKMTLDCQLITPRSENTRGSLTIDKIYLQNDPSIKEGSELSYASIKLSEADFYRLVRSYTIPFAYYFPTEKAGKEAEGLLSGKPFYQKTIRNEVSYNTAYYLKPFESLFSFFTELFFVCYIFSIGFYSIFLILENRYQIGVLKSLGYSSLSISTFFLLQILFVILCSAILYPIFCSLFSMVINIILSKTLLVLNFMSKAYIVLPIVHIGTSQYLFGILCSFALSLLAEVIFLPYLSKKKAADILQRKE